MLLPSCDSKVAPNKAVNLNVVLVYHRELGRCFQNVYERIRDLVNNFNSSYRFGAKPYAMVEAGDVQRHWGAVEKYFGNGKKLPSNIFLIDLCKPARRQALDAAYSVIKQMLGKAGHLSQFVNFNTCDHGNPHDARKSSTILQGVARQVLSKCGVRVWWVNIPKALPLPAVFVGVDVFHAPRKYDKKANKRTAKESVAAVIVQVLRKHPSECPFVEIYSETARREHVGQELELGPVIYSAISNALKLLKVDPMSCIVWRDGVGDAAIKQVAGQEIPQIRKALAGKVMGAGKKKLPCPLSYMVCQKRIAIKFLSSDGSQAMPVGTLVTALQGPEHATFYINGTAPDFSTPKPARFVIALRDKQLLNCSMSELSWALCHDYPNWTGPIKLPHEDCESCSILYTEFKSPNFSIKITFSVLKRKILSG